MRGGVRIGAGRPKGGKNGWSMRDYFNGREIAEIAQQAKSQYKSDNKVLVALLKYLFSEAPKSLNLEGNLKNTYLIEFEIKNPIALAASETARDSGRFTSILSDSNRT